MVDDFIVRALIAGCGMAAMAAPLGCFVVWRKMAYFGDALAHSALLGVALGALIGNVAGAGQTSVYTFIGISVTGLCFAALLLWLQHKRILATDSLLGILAHSGLSFGLIAAYLLRLPASDIHSFLFGDILTITTQDIVIIYVIAVLVLLCLSKLWASLTLLTLHEDLAKAEGVRVFWVNLAFLVMMTLVVAVSVRMVGVLLITSLLILPAATARPLSRSPYAMGIIAAIVGVLAVLGGIQFSLYADTPSGASIVVVNVALCVLGWMLAPARRSRE